METLIAILGSSAFVGITTSLINWVQNRKNNTLNYITQERKEWREKIRNIAVKIADCKYGDEKIKLYFNELQININPYGMESQFNYQEDGHIWDCIKNLENASDVAEFEKNRKLLLKYLSLLLKKDWEIVKKEVQGYAGFSICIILSVLQLVFYIFYQFYILRLNSMVLFGIALVLCFAFPLVYFFTCVLEMKSLEKSKSILGENSIIKKKQRMNFSYKKCFIFLLMFISLNVIIMFYSGPKLIVSNISNYTNGKQFYICTEWNADILKEFKEYVRNETQAEVVIVDTVDKVPVGFKGTEAYKELLLKEIRNRIKIWVILAVDIFAISWFIELYYLLTESSVSGKYNRIICILKFGESCDYVTNYCQLSKIIQNIDYQKDARKRNEDYLNMAYKIAEDLKVSLQNDIVELEKSCRGIGDYDELAKKQKQEENLVALQRKIEKAFKVHKIERKEELKAEMLILLDAEELKEEIATQFKSK